MPSLKEFHILRSESIQSSRSGIALKFDFLFLKSYIGSLLLSGPGIREQITCLNCLKIVYSEACT